MNKREREARRWWRQARRDLESAEVNARHGIHEVACFLSQQAAEKGLKALLYAQGESPVLGHSLFDLTRRAADYAAAIGEVREPAKVLDGYYVSSRYPNGLTDDVAPVDFFDAGDSQRALTAAQTILEAVARRLPPAVTTTP
jgi:HEPN domain-containing protein